VAKGSSNSNSDGGDNDDGDHDEEDDGEGHGAAAAAGIDVLLTASSDGSLFVAGLAAALFDNTPRIRHSRNRLGRALALAGLAAVPPFVTQQPGAAASAAAEEGNLAKDEEVEEPAARRVFEFSRAPAWVDTSALPYVPPVVKRAAKGSKNGGGVGAASAKEMGSAAAEAAAVVAEATAEAAMGLCPGGGRAALTALCCAAAPLAGNLDLVVCSGATCGLVRVQSLAAAAADQFRS
jgi:hypothetical protein